VFKGLAKKSTFSYYLVSESFLSLTLSIRQMKQYCFLFIFQLLVLNGLLFSQQSRPVVSKEPSWISINKVDYSQTSLDKDAKDGYINISLEKQISLAEKSRYTRSSRKIISQAGVQNGSEISVSYDPSYEQLIFHSIRIIRKDETINKLDLSKIKVVHQEEDMTDFIYNGQLDAILILEDVRQGDIIEYSYTLKGFNPIFKNKYSDSYSMNFGVPIYQVYYKLAVPAGRKINIKYLNQQPVATVSAVGGQQVYEWRSNNIPSVVLQDFMPSWYDPYSQVLVSEFNSWKEVNNWAMELFPAKKTLSAPLQKKIGEIEKDYTNDADRTKAALQFVQDDIRYMGIEMGENSHKPADPSKIFAQRFGDCKEKSYLLCCMLNAMNIDACPVLINTVSKKNINALLPAPTNFDHVTVRIKLDSQFYWFDPTISYQRGDIKNIFYPDYQAGLVIDAATDTLNAIEFRNISSVHVKEYFKVSAMSGGGTLVVTSTFQGSEADDLRNAFNSETISEKMTSYQKFYATYFEDIKADSLTFTDDDSTGIFTTKEYYSIPNFWTLEKSGMKKFSFSAFTINSVIYKPKEKERTMPFRLLYPAKYTEELVIDLPEDWKVTDSETHLKNSNFTLNSRFYCLLNQVYLTTEYESLKDHTTLEESAKYFKDLKEYDDAADFEISSGDDTLLKKDGGNSAVNILTAVVLIGALFAAVAWWSKKH
jgi:transglutaminase-like putative cysteine protease